MAQREEILTITVDYEQAINGISKFTDQVNRAKDDQKLLKEELKSGQVTQKEYNRSMEESSAVIKNSQQSIQSLRKEIQNNIKIETEQIGSLKSLRAQLSNTTAAFDSLSKVERQGLKGQQLQKDIESLQVELRGAEEATGRFQRSVGDYRSAFGTAASSVSAFAGSGTELSESFGKAEKALAIYNDVIQKNVIQEAASQVMGAVRIAQENAKAAAIALSTKNTIAATVAQRILNVVAAANPYVLLAAAIATVAGGLYLWVSAANEAEKEQLRLNNAIEATGKHLAQIKEESDFNLAIAKASGASVKELRALELQYLRTALAAADANADMVNASQNATKEMKDTARQAQEESWNNLKAFYDRVTVEDITARHTINKSAADSAKKQLEIARALEDELIKETADAKELQLKQTTIQYDRQIEDIKKRIATEKTLTKKAIADLNQTIEALEKAKNAKLLQIENDFNIERRAKDIQNKLEAAEAGSREELAIRLSQLGIQQEAELKEAEKLGLDKAAIVAKYEKIAQDQIDKTNKATIDKQTEITKKILDAAKESGGTRAQQAVYDAESAIAAKKQEIANMTQLVGESDEAFLARKKDANSQLMSLAIDYNKAVKAAEDEDRDRRYAEIQDMVSKSAAMFSVLNGLLEDFGAKSELLSAFAKATALFELGLNNARAIAAGVASAMAVPFPGNIAALATTLATIVSTIASAKKIISGSNQPKWSGSGSSSRQGKVQYFSDGGYVEGAGSSTSDSIPAQLSDGEYVVNAAATRSLGVGFLDIINSLGSIGSGLSPLAVSSAGQAFSNTEVIRELKGMQQAILERPSIVSVQDITLAQTNVSVRDTSRSGLEE